MPTERADPKVFSLFRELQRVLDNDSIPILRSAVKQHTPELVERFDIAVERSEGQLRVVRQFLAFIFDREANE